MQKRRFIIFGLGKVLQAWIHSIDLNEVIAFADNNFQSNDSFYYGKPVIKPQEIINWQYDYIALFSNISKEQMYNQLIEIGVEANKIISWQYCLQKKDAYDFFDVNSLPSIIELIKNMGIHSVLDIYMAFERYHIFTKDYIKNIDMHGIEFDGYRDSLEGYMPIYSNIYNNVYNSLDALVNRNYDAVILVDLFVNHPVSEGIEIIQYAMQFSKYIILTVPYSYPPEYTEWSRFEYAILGKVRTIRQEWMYIYIIEKEETKVKGSTHIYVVTHKTFTPPMNCIYLPLHAGKQGKQSLGYLEDDRGDNISSLNPFINECTALYWMWKHDNSKYIGLNHYRRYILRNNVWRDMNNIIDDEFVESILSEYDIIMTELVHTYPDTVSMHLYHSVSEDAYHTGMAITRDILHKKYPDYTDAFEYVFNGSGFYPCNIFVAKREIMNCYCEWLFGIIIDAAEKIDISSYDPYSKRIIGFIAERLFTVWLVKNKCRIKEFPLLFIDEPC